VARGVKFSVKRPAGGREACSTGSIAKGFSDDVTTVVLVAAGHALACEGVGGIVSLESGTTIACCGGGGIGHKARRTKAELTAINKLRVRESEARACGQGIEKSTCRSAYDTVKTGSVIRGSEGNPEVMILGVGIHSAGGFWRVDYVPQECRSNVLWVGWFWGADAGSVGEESEPKSLKFGAFTGKWAEHGRTFSESKVTSCSHGHPGCCGDLRGGEVKAKAALAQSQSELNFHTVGVQASRWRVLEIKDVKSCGCNGFFKGAEGLLQMCHGTANLRLLSLCCSERCRRIHLVWEETGKCASLSMRVVACWAFSWTKAWTYSVEPMGVPDATTPCMACWMEREAASA
jgi:hypothetical protein